MAVKFRWSGHIAATALEQKGLTQYGLLFFARFVQQTEVRRFINASDGEHSMKALKGPAAKAYKGVEAIPRESQVGDHHADWSVWVGCKNSAISDATVQLRFGTETLSPDHYVLTLTPMCAVDVIARLRKGADGKTPS